MGCILTKRGLVGLAYMAGLSLIGAASTQTTHAQLNTAAAQAYPIISLDTALARDAETFDDDKALNQSCRESGHNAELCLCLTHVMKYELTLTEYQAATRLFGKPKDRAQLYQQLRQDNFSSADIGTAEEMERNLISAPDFGQRCTEAKAYYRQSNG